jgi:acetyltransferase-like isoleucine patch superfamily enzyme
MMAILYSIGGVRGGLLLVQRAAFRISTRAELGRDARVFGWPIVAVVPGSRIVVGERAMLISHSYFSAPGVSHPCVLRTIAQDAEILIGDDVGMSGCSVVAAGRVVIGDGCLLGADVMITDTDFHPLDPSRRREAPLDGAVAPVSLGQNVFVGAGARILKGVTIGPDAVIGAASVVTRDVPAGAIVAGAPARVVGDVRGR